MYLPNVESFDVDGIHVLLRSSKTPVISVDLFIRGANNTAANASELAQEYFVLKTMIKGGTTHLSTKEYRRAILKLYSQLDLEWNRDFGGVTMKCVPETWDSSWSLFTDLIQYPAFDSSVFINEVQTWEVEMAKIRSSPSSYLRYLADSIYLHGHSYGFTVESGMRDLTVDDLPLAHNSMFVKRRLLLVVVGDISRASLEAKIHRSLGQLPEGEFSEPPIPAPARATKNITSLLPFTHSIPTSYVVGYFPVPNRKSSDRYSWDWFSYYFPLSLRRYLRAAKPLYGPSVITVNDAFSYGIIFFATDDPKKGIELANEGVMHAMGDRWFDRASLAIEAQRRTFYQFDNLQSSESQAHALGVAELLARSWRDAYPSQSEMLVGSETSLAIQRAGALALSHINWFVLADTSRIAHLGFER